MLFYVLIFLSIETSVKAIDQWLSIDETPLNLLLSSTLISSTNDTAKQSHHKCAGNTRNSRSATINDGPQWYHCPDNNGVTWGRKCTINGWVEIPGSTYDEKCKKSQKSCGNCYPQFKSNIHNFSSYGIYYGVSELRKTVAINPSGNMIVAAPQWEEAGIKTFNLTDETKTSVSSCYKVNFPIITFSGDGNFFACTCSGIYDYDMGTGHTIWIQNLNTSSHVLTQYPPNYLNIKDFSFSDEELVVLFDGGNKVNFHSATSGDLIRSIITSPDNFSTISFDGKLLAGWSGTTIKIHNLGYNLTYNLDCTICSRKTPRIKFSPDGSNVCALWENNDIFVWTAENGKFLTALQCDVCSTDSLFWNYFTCSSDMVIAGTGTWIGDSIYNNHVRVWDISTGVTHDFSVESNEKLFHLSVNRDGNFLVMATNHQHYSQTILVHQLKRCYPKPFRCEGDHKSAISAYPKDGPQYHNCSGSRWGRMCTLNGWVDIPDYTYEDICQTN